MATIPEICRLRCGSATAEVAASAGARLMGWSIGGRPVLHWPAEPDWAIPAKIRGGNPLLFPFIARSFVDGRVGRWRGPDGKERPAPMHGLVRAAPFSIEEATADRICMRLVSDESMSGVYPFPFALTVGYELEAEALAAAFTVENRGHEPMPYSLGNHFYFDVPAGERVDWTLVCPSRRWARQEGDGRIVPAPPPDSRGSLADGELVDMFHVGPARDGVCLRHSGDGRAVAFTLLPDAAGGNPWYAVTTWTEADSSDFFCVEPWTALPDAAHNQQGLRWLKPGSRETLRLRLTATGW